MSSSPLDEYDESVLREIAAPNRGSDQTGLFRAKSDLEDEFGKDSHRLGIAIENLKDKRHYIKDIEAVLASIGDTSIDYDAYQITALGKNYLAKASSTNNSFSNITNSNIANHSTNVQQSISIFDQPQEIQEKYAELQTAVLQKDGSAIKKTFGYIADKAVDASSSDSNILINRKFAVR